MRFRTSALVLLVLLVVVGAPACSRSSKPSANKSASPTPPAAAKAGFKATAVQAVDVGDRPEANEKATQVAPQIVELVNSYYTIAFIDSAKWGGGTHPDLAGLFAGSMQPQVAAQIQGLALGDLAPRIRSVTPDKQEVAVKVDVENDTSTPVISAVTAFEATAETKEKSDGPVKIVHTLRILVAPDGGSFKIAGGSAELKADTAAAALTRIDRTASLGGSL